MKNVLTPLVGKGDETRSPCICSHGLLLPEQLSFQLCKALTQFGCLQERDAQMGDLERHKMQIKISL